jgi:hypothetical protein
LALRLVFMARRVSRFLFDLIEGGARWPAAAAAASEVGGRLRRHADLSVDINELNWPTFRNGRQMSRPKTCIRKLLWTGTLYYRAGLDGSG